MATNPLLAFDVGNSYKPVLQEFDNHGAEIQIPTIRPLITDGPAENLVSL